nr:uncharacterized protein LOC109174735 [Ipomoea batatas]
MNGSVYRKRNAIESTFVKVETGERKTRDRQRCEGIGAPNSALLRENPEVEYTSDANLEDGQHQSVEHRPTNNEVNFSNDKGIELNLGESVKYNSLPNLLSLLWLGRYFLCEEDFKNAMKTYVIQFGKELKFKKNDKVWIQNIKKCYRRRQLHMDAY